ncbi:hypothetical protein [Aeoliella sp. SH292]|uniref:hypothetical protein n=1 Tax=Aeoliella sp. SH292 TaxID=3454464 RepID=UPI003F98FB06
MKGKIFNIQDDGRLVEMSQEGFVSEDAFQTLLQDYPDLLAGDQIQSDSPRRWLLVSRELGVADELDGSDRWSLDHLFIDQDGIPTLVEVKRATDTRLRREVVGQILDYAANGVVHWPLEKLRAAYEQHCNTGGVDPQEKLIQFLPDGVEPEQFWQSVKSNLQSGRVRMLIVADEIPKELQRIIEFLNEQLDPAEILAVEIRHFVGQGLKTLVPRVIGQTAEAQARKQVSGTRKPPLTAEELQSIADENGVGEVFRSLAAAAQTKFDAVRTTRSNLGFDGIGPNGSSKLAMLGLYPAIGNGQQGLYMEFYVDRIAHYCGIPRQALLKSLPSPLKFRPYDDGEVGSGYIKSFAEVQPLLAILPNRPQ